MVARQLVRENPALSGDALRAKVLAGMPATLDAPSQELVDRVLARLPRAQAAPHEPADTRSGASPSAILLVAANVLPLYGVLAWEWDVFALILLFWMENVVIGVLNVAKMLAADPADLLGWGAKLFFVPFFCVHYGLFTAGHGVFVLSFFGGQGYAVEGLNPLPAAARAAADHALWIPIAALAASHLFSFFWNYLHRGEYLRLGVEELMTRPYGRVVVLHVAIIFGGMATMALGSPLWALVLLLVLKTVIDVAAHRREHRPAVPTG